MSQDTSYAPVPMLYESHGLVARFVADEAPPNTYLNAMNCLERAENAMSSRYGTQIINRDPVGTGPIPVGTANYFFDNPITTLARLTYLTSAYRYGGDSEGNLYRRAGNVQGQYANIYTGLSGQPFGWLVNSCFESSQSYLFIYDQNVSIKDRGIGTPQLTGIDPPAYTANSLPYSPLLTLIDNFSAFNTYTTTGFSSAWTYELLTALEATSGQFVTDFPELFGVQPEGAGSFPISGGTTSTSATAPASSSASSTYSGFPSESVTGTEIVSLQFNLSGGGSHLPGRVGDISVTISYSIDSGATFTPFYSQSGIETTFFGASISQTILGVFDIDTIQVKVDVSVTATGGTCAVSAVLSDITAVIASPDVFGQVTDGMLSVIHPGNTTVNVPISSVVSSNPVGGIYQNLTISTPTGHGLSGLTNISIYGSSNDLVDGFYLATVVDATTLSVSYISSVLIGSTGGVLGGGAAAPSTVVLTSEYSTPYPSQMSAWGFYQQLAAGGGGFPVGAWTGTVAQNTTATVGQTVPINLNINNQATDDDLIVLTLAVGDPAAIGNIRLQFDVNGSNYTSSYYYKDISPAYYQSGVQQLEDAYDTTEQQIFADTLGLITGAPPNTTTAQLQPGNISTGQNAWQTVYLRRGDFLPVGSAGQSGSDWAAISGWQIVFTTNTVGSSTVSTNGLYFQWGYGPSSFGGVGYDYRYTYYNSATGTESNGSPIQNYNQQFGYLASLTAPFFLRQAAQVTGQYSTDPQVTHVRIYRRGGLYSSNWFNIDQVPNITGGGEFFYKDVIPDAALAQAPTLILDNDPPVTSSLQFPIATTLSSATTSPGNALYNIFAPQTITVAQSTANFVTDQIVVIGNAINLEQVRVITGGTGTFTAIVRLQHNVGEQVNVYSIPRTPCDLCAVAYGQTWLAGDKNNSNFLYYSKPGYPENFGPENYIPVGDAGDTINEVVDWRGTLFVGTQKTWFSIVGGSNPIAQPTGSEHGPIAKKGSTVTESGIAFRASDGLRRFSGSNSVYMTLPVEWIYRQTPQTPLPLADPNQIQNDVLAFYNNVIYASYVSLTNNGQRYRLNFDTSYSRFGIDDVPATAMLWEKDSNVFLVAKQIAAGQYAIVQDQVGDYDDGGWSGSALVKTPIALTIQTPYRDLGKPHYPKQWNVLECDANSAGQLMSTTLMFDTEPPLSVPLASFNTGNERDKVQLQINNGKGIPAYSMSLIHTISVTTAPVLYQENIYAAVLADYRTSYDSYWIKFGTDASKLVKQGYFDYTSTATILCNLYADGSDVPYFTFSLPAAPNRAVVRVRFGNNDGINSAMIMRLFRIVANCSQAYQFWKNPRISWKQVAEGQSYAIAELSA